MQLIEETPFGVRSAVITLHRDSSPTVVLYPMLHLGTPEFYERVHAGLAAADRIVIEGVRGRRSGYITLAYGIAAHVRHHGLVDQGRALDLSDLEEKLVRPDATAEQFARSWKRASRGLRWLVLLVLPFYAVWIAIVGPRRAMGHEIAVEDLPTSDEALMSDGEATVIAALKETATTCSAPPSATSSKARRRPPPSPSATARTTCAPSWRSSARSDTASPTPPGST